MQETSAHTNQCHSLFCWCSAKGMLSSKGFYQSHVRCMSSSPDHYFFLVILHTVIGYWWCHFCLYHCCYLHWIDFHEWRISCLLRDMVSCCDCGMHHCLLYCVDQNVPSCQLWESQTSINVKLWTFWWCDYCEGCWAQYVHLCLPLQLSWNSSSAKILQCVPDHWWHYFYLHRYLLFPSQIFCWKAY